jgi:tetratricopeptide (TPR) repeat protein
MAKKVTRKQLLKEPDEFMTFTGKMIRLFRAHQNQVVIAIGIGISLLLIFSLIKVFINRAENNAFTLLNHANNKYNSIFAAQDAASALKEVEKDFEYILSKYSRYQGGKIARVNFASYNFHAGEYDRAAILYSESLKDFGKNSSYRNLILNGLGYSYKGKEDYEASAKYFEMIVSSNNHVLRDEALFNLSKIYAILGKDNKRTEALETIASDYPESIYIELVRGRIPG